MHTQRKRPASSPLFRLAFEEAILPFDPPLSIIACCRAALVLAWVLAAEPFGADASVRLPEELFARIVNPTDRTIGYRVARAHEAAVSSVALAAGAVHHVRLDTPTANHAAVCEYVTNSSRRDARRRSVRLLPGKTYRFRSLDTATGEVVLEAVAQAAEAQRRERELRVLIVAGSAYRRFLPHWRTRTEEIVRRAAAHFALEFGIRLRIDAIAPWTFRQAPSTADTAMEQLHRQIGSTSGHDLIIAFTLFAFPSSRRGNEIRGLSQYFSRYVIVPDAWRPVGAASRLVHEMGHVFGAFHDRTAGSIMAPVYRATPAEIIFSRPTLEIVAATRHVDLKQGVRSLDDRTAEQIQRLYQLHRHPREPAERDPISAAYRHLADRAEWDGEPEQAAALRRQADRARRRAAEFMPSPAATR